MKEIDLVQKGEYENHIGLTSKAMFESRINRDNAY